MNKLKLRKVLITCPRSPVSTKLFQAPVCLTLTTGLHCPGFLPPPCNSPNETPVRPSASCPTSVCSSLHVKSGPTLYFKLLRDGSLSNPVVLSRGCALATPGAGMWGWFLSTLMPRPHPRPITLNSRGWGGALHQCYCMGKWQALKRIISDSESPTWTLVFLPH